MVPHLQGESDPLGREERQPAAQAFFWPSLSGCTADTQEHSHNEPQRRQKQPAAVSNPCIGREGEREGKERESKMGERERGSEGGQNRVALRVQAKIYGQGSEGKARMLHGALGNPLRSPEPHSHV